MYDVSVHACGNERWMHVFGGYPFNISCSVLTGIEEYTELRNTQKREASWRGLMLSWLQQKLKKKKREKDNTRRWAFGGVQLHEEREGRTSSRFVH